MNIIKQFRQLKKFCFNLCSENKMLSQKKVLKKFYLNKFIQLNLFYVEKQKLKNKVFLGVLLKKKNLHGNIKFYISIDFSTHLNSKTLILFSNALNIKYYNYRKSELN